MLRNDIEFLDPGPAVTDEHIAEFKGMLAGHELPREYELYLRRFNGARPRVGGASRPEGRSSHVRIWWPAKAVGADVWGLRAGLGPMCRLGTNPAEGPELRDVHEVLADRFPPQSFAFAGSGGGSKFLFDLRPERFGQVLFWCRPCEVDEESHAGNPYQNVAWVAHDFIDFLNRIEVEPDDWAAWEAAQPPASAMDWSPT